MYYNYARKGVKTSIMHKKTFKRILLLFIAGTLLVSCSPHQGDGLVSGTTIDPPPGIALVADGISDYVIVTPQSEGDMYDIGYLLFRRIQDATGVSLLVVQDNYPENDHEILLGPTNRTPELTEDSLEMPRDFIIQTAGEKVCLFGLNTAAVSAAVEEFVTLFVDAVQQTVTVPQDICLNVSADIRFAELVTDEYIIVAGSESGRAALELQSGIEKLTGYKPDVVGGSTAESEYEILVGQTGRAETAQAMEGIDAALDYTVQMIGSKLVVAGGGTDGTALAVEDFCGRLEEYMFRDDLKIAEDISIRHQYGKESAVDFISSIRNDPEFVVSEEQMRVERARIYTPSDDEDWYYSHHPFVTGFDGKLYAFYSSGRRNEDDCGQRIMMAISENFTDWQVSVLVDSIQGTASELVCYCKGCYVYEGKLRVFYQSYEYDPATLRQNSDGTPLRPLEEHAVRLQNGVFYVETADGVNWSEPVSMGTVYGGNLNPESLADGRLLWAGYGSLSWSDDPSAIGDWTNIRLVRNADVPVPRTVTESGFYQTADGVIYLLSRTNDQYLYASASFDNGATWTDMYPTAFPDTSNKFQFGTLPDGRYYFIGGISRSRSEIILMTSDDGLNFNRWYRLADEPYTQLDPDGMYKNGTYGYMTTDFDSDYLYVIYSLGKESLEILRVPLEDIGVYV